MLAQASRHRSLGAELEVEVLMLAREREECLFDTAPVVDLAVAHREEDAALAPEQLVHGVKAHDRAVELGREKDALRLGQAACGARCRAERPERDVNRAEDPCAREILDDAVVRLAEVVVPALVTPRDKYLAPRIVRVREAVRHRAARIDIADLERGEARDALAHQNREVEVARRDAEGDCRKPESSLCLGHDLELREVDVIELVLFRVERLVLVRDERGEDRDLAREARVERVERVVLAHP
ncbi:MAG: hypothetical protein UU82_C0011G0003 [Candidatus Nomurabacteria bacterium GW2011_GWC2_41_8]|uniref:Uncharacterized protein n=1 Tax=Candidatus Nomurabacteria bacterium GW2011_GWC2_41_8 TaxID=1618755 RepID=A0A0G0XI63_9BACT|nr:MAG: hypothetical protein UU82_C0011G0003 [Candidatus Nomurabacteria bacterium GW2011_GWC2_41_8]